MIRRFLDFQEGSLGCGLTQMNEDYASTGNLRLAESTEQEDQYWIWLRMKRFAVLQGPIVTRIRPSASARPR